MQQNRSLIFWLDQPPKVGKGCFNYISKAWGGKVIYAYLHGFSTTRKNTGWDDGNYGEAHLIELSGNINERVSNIFAEEKDAIHIIGGFKSSIIQYLNKYIFSDKYLFVCFSERPGVYGKWWKRLIKRLYIPISEKIIAKKYQKHIKAYLPLGMKGCEENKKYGWEEKKLYPFMYDPEDCVKDKEVYPVHSPMRFLYVGRFSRYTKGTDTLKLALEKVRLDEADYTVDFVGGYGDMREEMLPWIAEKKNMRFLGIWDSLEVGNNMKEYDVCLVPSKFDGWNLLVNESIRAHIAILASDEAVSHELVVNGNVGRVFQANRPTELSKIIMETVKNPKLVEQWKYNAREYSKKITSKVVGEYFMSILRYECLKEGQQRPSCPW